MNYTGIVNCPNERTSVTYPWVWWDGAFSPEEIERIRAHVETVDTVAAEILGGKNSDIRTSDIAFLAWSGELDWMFRRFNDAVQSINNRWYGFALNGYESIQLTQYRAESLGHYDWHMDLCMGQDHLPAGMIEPRKLSLSMLLDEPGEDFEGGAFEINLGQESERRTCDARKGRILAFPSFMIHRVTPVTRGLRRSLVIWVTGPKLT